MWSRGCRYRCVALLVLAAMSIARTAVANDQPARSGFWRIASYGVVYPGGDHVWSLENRTLYRLDRFGGKVAMTSLKEVDGFLPINGTLSGWATSKNSASTDDRDRFKVQFLDDSGTVAFSAFVPYCEMATEATSSYLWMDCHTSVIRVGSHEPLQEFDIDHVGDIYTFIYPFDDGRGAWVTANEPCGAWTPDRMSGRASSCSPARESTAWKV